jgi:hypothetical protein
VQLSGDCQSLWRSMGAGPVGQQPDLAGAAVPPAQLAEERLRVGLPGMAADQHDAMGGPQIDRTE